MPNIGKIIRVNALPPIGERETNVIYQVAAPGSPSYTDYAVDESGDLKTHAVVNGTIPLELADNHISITNADLLAEGIASQAEYNLNTRERLAEKVTIPLTDGNAQDYPKIIGMNDNGEVAKLPAGDLGKNVANSSLTSVAGAGLTLGANWILNTSGLYYSITGLSDVSNDSTFSTFLSQNASGRVGKTNGKQPFLSLPTTLTNAEKTVWKTAMNGGWTTATMSVASILPPVVDRSNKPSWITLKGANLNLPPTSFKIELCTEASTDLNPVVVAEIPGSQVQLYDNGTDLSFWFNFSTIAEGKYKIRLWNGVAYYLTGANTMLQVVNSTVPFIPSLIWSYAEFTPGTGTMIGGNSSVTYNSNQTNKAYAGNDLTTVSAGKSSELFGADDNFYLRMGINITNVQVGLDNNTPFVIGLCNSMDSVALTDLSVIKGRGIINYRGGGISIYPDLSSQVVSFWAIYTGEMLIIRNNGLFTISVTMNNTTRIYAKAAPAVALSLFAMIGNSPSATTASFNILEQYKF
ncbi:hypothetical protein [Chryseobacterium taeanense]|uniref:hypothetical protein n=1 Tax=Chryseobacterium taeanense TaxID=311334 RepID=UPI0035B4B833